MTVDFNTLAPPKTNPNTEYADDWKGFGNAFHRHWGIGYETFMRKRYEWRTINESNPNDDRALTKWLIEIFDLLFYDRDTVLVRGDEEPEYLAWRDDEPAQIVFAHGYFSSALHEIAHWCIAGQERRKLDDFGYWYAPDGRTQEQQQLFEKVEIKPQAIECLFTLACGRKFFVSQDNLGADFDTSNSTFAQDVYDQAKAYLTGDSRLPSDAFDVIQMLLWCNGASLIKD